MRAACINIFDYPILVSICQFPGSGSARRVASRRDIDKWQSRLIFIFMLVSFTPRVVAKSIPRWLAWSLARSFPAPLPDDKYARRIGEIGKPSAGMRHGLPVEISSSGSGLELFRAGFGGSGQAATRSRGFAYLLALGRPAIVLGLAAAS